MARLKQVVQTWEDADGNYTVTTTYDDAGNGTVVDSRVDAALVQPPIPVVADEVHEKAVAAVQASVAAGDISPAQGAEAVNRLNAEKANAPLNLPPLTLGAIQAPPAEVSGAASKTLSHLRSHGVVADTNSHEAPAVKVGPLPKDFPYLHALQNADPPINTYHQLAKFADDYTQIPHVGKVGAKAIAEAVK